MGKVITATEDVKAEIPSPRGGIGLYEESFWGFLVDAMNQKGPVETLEKIDVSIGIVRKLKQAKEDKAQTITLEDAEFKILEGAMKAIMKDLYPAIAREVRGFYRCLDQKTDKNPDGYQDVELATKK